jgi:exosortase E/protease (VPEID-CTERM system)
VPSVPAPPDLNRDLTPAPPEQASGDARPGPFLWRLGVFASVIFLEGLRSSVNIGRTRNLIAQEVIAFLTMFLVVGYPTLISNVRSLARVTVLPPISWRFTALHALAVAVIASRALEPRGSSLYSGLLIAAWLILGLAGIAAAAAAVFPFRIWSGIIGTSRRLWPAALVLSVFVWFLGFYAIDAWDQSRWSFAQDVTFQLVSWMLAPFLSPIIRDPVTRTIGSETFSVSVAPLCSGWEGLGLALVFAIAWLWLSRRVYRFPRALILIPGALALIFFLNAVRIAALILIGHHGAPLVATTGFHSQAGWIGFNLVVLGVAVISPRIPWLVRETESRQRQAAPNPTVAYLLPFAVILAAGLISRAASAEFEWLYPLRFAAAAIALYAFRREYRDLIRWPGWESWACGAVVFLIWIGLDRGAHADSGLAAGLRALPAPARVAWLVCRVLGAVVTVPIAEELAFRGFLLRRLVAEKFEDVDLGVLKWPALLISSLAFGLMHGDRWIAGAIAGGLYAAVMIRRRSLVDAAVAHATTNALIASLVLMGGRWDLW